MKRSIVPVITLLVVLLLAPAARATISPSPQPGVWGTNGRVRALMQRKGVVYVGGSFTEAVSPDGTHTLPRRNLMALDATTGKPTDWNPGANDLVLTIARHGPNIFVGGRFTDIGNHIADISPSGALMDGFKGTADRLVRSIDVVGSDLYVGGDFTSIDHVAQPFLAKLGIDGRLQPDFAPDVNGPVFGSAPFANGDLLIVGLFSAVDGHSTGTAAVVDPTGAPGPALVRPPSVKSMSVHTVGTTGFVGVGSSGNEMLAYDQSGAKLWRVGCNGDVQAIGDANGEVIMGGHYGTCGGTTAGKLTAIRFDGTIDRSWKPRVKGDTSRRGVFALLSTSTTLWAGGDFTAAGGASTPHVAEWQIS
jgi:hypothetical protein